MADEANSDPEKKVNSDAKGDRIGCSHYARKCILISPCCNKEYTCRLCHDDAENHELNRQKVQKVKCAKCHHVQQVQKSCEKCDTVFGWYFCEVCRLYDDEDKGQFHCEGCGLCRVGGKDKFFHCDKCGICLGVTLQGNHKCVEESSRRNCAVCLEDLHTSRIDAHIPACGHLIHTSCMRQCIKTGNYACPTCAQSLFDMKGVWSQLDDEVANTPMPDEYKDLYVFVLCRDCHKESKVKFHVIGLKCQECGSYNTCRTKAPEEDTKPKVPVGQTRNGPGPGSDQPPEGSSGGASGGASGS